MTIEIKTGRTDGIVTSWNLVFSNGLRLKTADNLAWIGKDGKDALAAQFSDVVAALRAAGFDVTGDIERS